MQPPPPFEYLIPSCTAVMLAMWRIYRVRLQRAAVVHASELRSLAESCASRQFALERQLADAAERAEAAETELRNAFEAAPVGMISAGPQGRILRVNRRCCEITGYLRQELLRMQLPDLLHADDRAGASRRLERLRGGQPAEGWEACSIRQDGSSVPVQLTATVTGTAAGSPVYGIWMRETAVRPRPEGTAVQAELLLGELVAVKEHLLHLRKFETFGRLAGGAAAKFNGHLTVINGYCDMLLEELAEDDPLREEIGHIRAAGGQAAVLASQLLDMNRTPRIAKTAEPQLENQPH